MSIDDTSGLPAVRPPLALIAGPTASGKSDLAVRLALRLAHDGRRAVVINADSAQVYRELSVLSARPSRADMCGIEHRLFGEWCGAEACSAPAWAARAKAEIAALHDAGAVPILVGGTGLYLRTLLDGIAPIPDIDGSIRREVRALHQSAARAALEREDVEAAARIAPADRTRTQRALEVIRSTGSPIAAWQEHLVGGIGKLVALHPLIVRPPRETLFARCDTRFAAMVDNGAVEEVAQLIARRLDPALPIMRAIGVRELAAWLAGDCDREAMLAASMLSTRRYAKRQYTWFRNQKPENWLVVETISCDLHEHFASLLRDI